MVVFGGRDFDYFFNDLWILDLNTLSWSQVSASGDIPSPRQYHSATFIPTDNTMILFGGYSRDLYDEYRYSDLYFLDLSIYQWTQIEASGELPLDRDSHSAMYDATNNRIIMFGGIGEGWIHFDDFWEFNLGSSSWTKIFPLIVREAQSMVLIPTTQELVLWGGKQHPAIFYDDGYLISFTGGGPGPQNGDVNCDGKIDLFDVVYLANYLFKGGPPPCSGK